MSAPARLPVREHLRPQPRRDSLATVPPELRAKLPPAFARSLELVLVFGQVDRASHPQGWEYDFVGQITPAEAESLPWQGQA